MSGEKTRRTLSIEQMEHILKLVEHERDRIQQTRDSRTTIEQVNATRDIGQLILTLDDVIERAKEQRERDRDRARFGSTCWD